MSNDEIAERFASFYFPALEETFTKVNGIFLDKRTSLAETLAPLSAAQASEANGPGQATIAAQVEHVAFYIEVLERYMNGENLGKVDWQEIWQRRSGVTDTEWDALRARVVAGYERVLHRTRQLDWRGENDISGALAILVHTAYHLGGLRMTIGAVTRRA